MSEPETRNNEDLFVELANLLAGISWQMQNEITHCLKPFKLTRQQFNVLEVLGDVGSEGLPSLEISRRLVEGLPDITRLIDRLVHAGLVRRTRSAVDRRVVIVKLTDTGRQRLGSIMIPVREVYEKYARHLDLDESTQLKTLLTKLRKE